MSGNEKEYIWYKLVFKQNQPIHIGSFKWGVVNQTEIFIPGQTIWGALVKAYIERNNVTIPAEVENIKKAFETITVFYPSFNSKGEEILFPSYKRGEFHLGPFSEKEFRLLFVDADFKTSIEPIYRRAKEEHLYEFEYLLYKPKNPIVLEKILASKNPKEKLNLREVSQIYWVGLIRIPNIIKFNSFFQKGLTIFLGGDNKYGFGELELIDKYDSGKLKNIEINQTLNQWNVNEDGFFSYKKEDTLKNFLQLNCISNSTPNFEGEIKVLVENNFKQNPPKVEKADYFLNIGGKLSEELKLKKCHLVKGRFIHIS